MKRRIAVCCLFLLLVGCGAYKPAHLTPQANVAFTATKVIHALDILRDTAVAANAQMPPVLSTATTRKVVEYHKAAMTIIHATPQGYVAAVRAGLLEIQKEVPPADTAELAPYFALVNMLITEASK